MKCSVCCEPMDFAFNHEVMGKYEAEYWNCSACGYMKVHDPIWLKEAYLSPITNQDHGLLARNIHFSRQIIALIDRYLDTSKIYLDYAGGYGVFTRLMRDAGIKFVHDDPNTENIFARDFVYDNTKHEIAGITCFECLEHFVDPVKELEKIFQISPNVFFSTELKPLATPDTNWHYFAFEHGQHVSFYSQATLETLAEKFGLNLVSTGYLHYFSEAEINNYTFKKIAKGANKRRHWFAQRTLSESISRRINKSQQR